MNSFSVCVQHLCKYYGTRRVFDNITFSHTKGILGIAGPNGSGKSTLLQCLAGLNRLTSGSIEWQKDHKSLKTESIKKNLGYEAPYINLYNELSCAENLHFLLKLRGINKKNSAVEQALKRTALSPFASQLFGNLSTGQQQRLRIASALVHQPSVLFLDEPGSNLDEKGRVLIETLVSEFRHAAKLVMIASNNPEELDLCDKIYSVEKEKFV